MSGPSGLVKPAQRRGRDGLSTICIEPAQAWNAGEGRVYVKRQQAYWCRPPWRLYRRTPMLRRELRGLEACRRHGIGVPRVVTYRERGSLSELVLEEVQSATPFDEALAAAPERDLVVREVAAAIGRLHGGGWTHGALYPAHILVGAPPDHAVTLIDLEKARHNPLRRHADLARFWRYCPPLTGIERALFERHYRRARRHRPE
ncbi:MAG: lipopolysaccharide kinase InaA family protein [Pseudomonadales bacterium]